MAFFIVLSVLLFNVSFKTPFSNPFFQGFNRFGANSTLIPWHFTFPSSTPTFSSNSSFSATVNATDLPESVDLVKSHEGNGSEIVSSGKGMDLEETHLSNFTGKGHEANGSEFGRSGKTLGSAGKGMDFEQTHLSDFTYKPKNRSFNVITETRTEGELDVGIVSAISSIVNKTSNGEDIVVTTSEEATKMNNQGTLSGEENSTISSHGSNGECDIFDGRWVRDDTKPYYPPGSCPYIDRDFDCHLNKRPDDGFVKWKWQPSGCDIPSLNATDFLERLRGKKLVFVGDSLNRNMWESLVCILRQSIKNKKRVYEISGRREFKKKGFYAFRFEDYNCTVDFVSSPFLVRESSFSGRNGSFETLRLDLMDKTTSMYHDADVLIFNTGHWWTHEKTSKGEDYYQEGNHVYPRLKVLDAYTRALKTWARWVDKNIDGSRTQVIFRGYSVTHFRGGQWNSGGQCHKETEPILNNTHLAKYPSKMRALEYVLKDMKTPIVYLNISRLTDYRKDAHPSIYRMEYKTVEEQIAAVHSQDCSHWCLPGVPDTWNELIYASLLKVGRGSWKS